MHPKIRQSLSQFMRTISPTTTRLISFEIFNRYFRSLFLQFHLLIAWIHILTNILASFVATLFAISMHLRASIKPKRSSNSLESTVDWVDFRRNLLKQDILPENWCNCSMNRNERCHAICKLKQYVYWQNSIQCSNEQMNNCELLASH